MKRKVLFCVPPNVGGAERVTLTIAKLLDREKYDVKVVIVGRTKGEIETFIPPNTGVIHIYVRNIWDFLILKLIKLIKKEKPTHVFSSLHYLSIRIIIATKFFKNIKSVIRSDNYLSTLRKHSLFQVLHTFPWADILIAQQEEMQEEMQIAFSRYNKNIKVHCLHNPIDVESIERLKNADSPYLDNKEIRFVWTARYSKNKGQDLLIRAFKIVHANIANAHLYLVGKVVENDPYIMEIRQFLEQNNLTHCVHMVGFDKNPYRWIKHADCFVLPSRIEGLPNALIEAMYLGKPVVATKCIPIIERIVKDGYNGILTEIDDAKSLSDGMMKALSLRNYKMTYKPSNETDFITLFN